MSGHLTIRNLTTQPLTIAVVERYDAPSTKHLPHAERKAVVSSFSLWTTNDVSLTHGELGDKAKKYEREQVNARIPPYTAYKLKSKIAEREPGQLLRLTIHGEGAWKWRIDTPAPSSASRRLTPLVSNPAHEYAALYLPTPTLVIFENVDLLCWMKRYRDDTPLSALSIPGTHNTPTYHKALPSVRCQAVSPKEQLENGARFFDVRVQPTNPTDAKDDTLILVHGAFPVSLTGPRRFRQLADDMLSFLRTNPSETIILSMKREGTGNATDAQLSLILRDHYTAHDPSAWYTEPRIPNLGEARGKIVLMRRFALAPALQHEHEHSSLGWCINAEEWDYNSADCTHGDVRVQDFCEVLTIDKIPSKIAFCCDHFERAGQVICPIPGVTTDREHPVPPGPLYLNFLSASNFWKMGCWPERIAEVMNPAVLAFLCERHDIGDKGTDGPGERVVGDGGLGIVVCDWVGKDGDWDLVKIIVAMNGRLLLRQRAMNPWFDCSQVGTVYACV